MFGRMFYKCIFWWSLNLHSLGKFLETQRTCAFIIWKYKFAYGAICILNLIIYNSAKNFRLSTQIRLKTATNSHGVANCLKF